jgi:glycyl-tRNA synthetase
MELHERIFELALSRSFFFPSNEPYGAIAGFYDYGPVGVLIKHKIENLWREAFIKSEGFHEMEASLITPEPILIASGHVKSFADPSVQCTKCKTEVRADSFVQEKHYDLHGERWDGKLDTLDSIIKERKLKCPRCGGEFGKAFMFNMMFKTAIGGESVPAYARPETAQGTYTAFPRIFRNHGAKLPMAVGQVGRSFRNEISPRKGLVRMREFTQMELQNFFNPNSPQDYPLGKEKMRMKIDNKIVEMSGKELVEKGIVKNGMMAYFLLKQWEFYRQIGINEGKMHLRVLAKEEIPHYSQGNIDMEVETSYGVIETIGNAYRTDFDLSQHSKQSGKDFSVFIEEEKKKVMPHVFEVAMGVDRPFFCLLEHCFREKSAEKDWEWFDFPAAIAPYHAAVFPLMKKDGMDEKAKAVAKILRESGLDVDYRDSGSIGRRYARADEIGIPYAITIDYDTLKDETVTIRYRNDGKQERVNISEIAEKILRNVAENKVTL